MNAVIYPSVHSEVAFQPDRFAAKVLAESERTRVILACFEPGQFIPIHVSKALKDINIIWKRSRSRGFSVIG